MKNPSKKYIDMSNCWNTHGVWSNADERCEKLEEYVHCRNCPTFSAGGKKVLDRVAPVGYLKGWRKTLSAKESDHKIDDESVLVFRVNGEWFALPAGCLHEIAEERPVHRIPRNTSQDICGVVNIGGEVRICYSLENILGVNGLTDDEMASTAAAISRLIVVLLGGQYYVFCVGQVSGLSWYCRDDVSAVPATLGHDAGDMLLGVIRHDGNNVAVLDVDKFQDNLEGIKL